jgi:choline dehydrogenase
MDEFDGWQAAAGPDWSAARLLEEFIALEDDELYGDAPYHGRGGPNPIVRQTEELWSSIDDAMLEAAGRQGLPWNPDCNAPESTGISYNAFNGRAGARHHAADVYLEPVRDRENLTIAGDALVDRVLFDSTGRASGVRVLLPDGPVDIEAGEVIVAAGAIHSPAILQRSGIGPADVLRAAGIELRVDLPVGEGLQEHPAVAVALPVDPASYRPPRLMSWLLMLRYSSGQCGADANDIWISGFAPTALDGFPFIIFGGELMRSFSTGTVRIRSADPGQNPEIDLRMLSDRRDLERMKTMLALTRELIADRAITKLSTGEPQPVQLTWGGMPDLSASFADLRTEAALERWLLATAHTSQHPAATCALGRVVGPDCAVHGVDGLRVIDASIAPRVPRANTNLTAIMIGEHMGRILSASTAAMAVRG